MGILWTVTVGIVILLTTLDSFGQYQPLLSMVKHKNLLKFSVKISETKCCSILRDPFSL